MAPKASISHVANYNMKHSRASNTHGFPRPSVTIHFNFTLIISIPIHLVHSQSERVRVRVRSPDSSYHLFRRKLVSIILLLELFRIVIINFCVSVQLESFKDLDIQDSELRLRTSSMIEALLDYLAPLSSSTFETRINQPIIRRRKVIS